MSGRQDGQPGKERQADFARFEIETPFDAAWLRGFLADPERLLRLNPFYTIREIRRVSPDELRLSLRNDALEREFDLTARVEELPGGWRLVWDGWLKSETRAQVKGSGKPAVLVLVDDYSGHDEAQRRERIAEVDISIAPWAQYVHAWMHMLRRFSWVPGFRWFMTGPWLRMTPAARRVSKWIIFITAAEFIFFLMVFSIFWLEYGG